MNDDSGAETITHLSLCAGYEGIGLGLKRVFPNLRAIAYVEREGFAVANLVAKMEEGRLDKAPLFTDVKTFPYGKFRGLVDILSGGFPCQPFSSAGKRDGVEDPRHLFPFIAKGIRQCRPKIVFLENVEGIISAKTHDGESVLQYVLRTLEDLDYDATAGIFSAAEVGASHQRKRVFILGYAQSSKSSGLPNEQREKVLAAGKSGETLAHPSSKRQGRRREPKNILKKDERQIEKLPPKPGGSSEKLADPNNSRGHQDRKQSKLWTNWAEQSPHNRWPSRPGETQQEWEESRTLEHSTKQGLERERKTKRSSLTNRKSGQTKSSLGRTTHGNSSRVDRLRLLGNGVVPATAEKAFRSLIDRLT